MKTSLLQIQHNLTMLYKTLSNCLNIIFTPEHFSCFSGGGKQQLMQILRLPKSRIRRLDSALMIGMILGTVVVQAHPTDIDISSFSVSENTVSGSVVGTLSTTDENSGNTFVYTLVSGAGDTDNGSFEIEGSDLKINICPDFESQSSYSVRIRTTDEEELSFEKVFTIYVNNINETPSIEDQSFWFNENTSVQTYLGTLAASDADGNNISFSITQGSDGPFVLLNNDELYIVSGYDFDFETQSTFAIKVAATDDGSPSLNKEVTVTFHLNDVNESPTDIYLSAASVSENVAAGTAIGELNTNDQDEDNTFTYTLVTGTGDTDNDLFTIEDNHLNIAISPDFEAKSSYSVRIRTTDQDNLSFEKAFTISILNVNEAPVANDATFTIDENSTSGTVAGTVSVSDPDANQMFSFSIASGNTDNAFAMSSEGEIVVTGTLDYETTSSYTLSIQVSDNGSPSQTVYATITIQVNDLIETGITTSSESLSFQLFPNPASGQVAIDLEGEAVVHVSDLSGRIVKEEVLNNPLLNIADLNAGVYAIEVVQGERRAVRKLVVE